MNLRHLASRLAGGFFSLALGAGAASGAEANRLSEAGMAILDPPDAWRAFVSGPVTSFAYGADGVLFVGSNRLAEFDGFAWHSIEVPGAFGIRALVPSKDGRRIWLGAVGMVGYVERNAQGAWSFFPLNAEFARAGVKDIGEVRYIHLLGEKIIFVERENVYRWTPPRRATDEKTGGGEGGRVEVWNHPSNPGRLRLYPFSDGGSLMFHQTGVGLWRMEESGPVLWLAENSLPSAPPMVGYVTMPNGNKFAVFSDEIFLHQGEKWTRMNEASDILRGKRAIRAVAMADGLMAVGTFYGGVVLVRSDGTVQDALTLANGLADLNIDKLWADDSGQLWIGMWTGFARLSDVGTATLFDQRLGFGTGVVLKVMRIAGKLTVVTSQGVYELVPSRNFEPATFTHSEVYFQTLRDGVELDGQIWLASYAGFWTVSGGKAVHEAAVSADIYFVEKLRALPHGLLFFENRVGKAWLRGEHGWFEHDLNLSLDSSPVSTLEDHDGRFWVSTLSGQVECFAWDNAARLLRPVAHFQPGESLPSAATRLVLSEVGGRVFAFTENEVLRLDRAGRRFEVVKELNDFVVSAADHAGGPSAYWVVRRKELGAIGLQALMRVEPAAGNDDSIRLIPLVAPGLDQIGEVLNVDVIPHGAGEELWIGGARALLRLEPSKLRAAAVVPAVKLRSVRVDAAELADITGTGRTLFPPTVSRLEFNFAVGVSATNHGGYFYQTRVRGIEAGWSAPQTLPRREFTGLAPGNYAFEARAVDRIGRTGEPLRYAFVVEAPWYRRGPALVAGLVLAGLLVAGGVKWRLRQLRRHAAKLNELVNVRTRELSLSNSAKSEFLENISHEIRNPLNGITGLIDLLDESGLSERQREHARALKECSQDLGRVFHEVLNFSKLEYGYVVLEERPFSLKALLESVRALFHAAAIGKGCTLAMRFPADFADGFWGDEAKLKSIVGNFVGNALKYAPGAPVEIAVTSLNPVEGRTDVLIEVTDHGRGVPPEEQELIFRKFVRGSNARRSEVPGAGIGLATCRALARLMGGSVGIESVAGKGATFFVKVPLRRESPAASAERSAAGPAAMLIVEDQHYNQIVLAGLTAKLGFAATCVRDGDEAVASVGRGAFDVILLDVELPRMKGPDVARRLRSLPGGARPLLIGVSANDSREAAARCLAAGMDAFLVKPLTLESLTDGLAEARARRQSDGGAGPAVPDFTALELYAQNAPGGLAGAVETYASILRDEIAALQEAIESRRPPAEVARAAHRVRSHAQIVGASGVIAAAARLESDARAGTVTNAAALLAQVRRAAEEIERALSERA
ncbi:MAG: hypothetical protein JWM88_1265 [Verrucomicrobia bacterium]|nr:hypothetical protein [Verrucomicrobiota bacterium]